MFQIFSKIWLINIALAALVVFFGMMSFDVWSKGDESISGIRSGKNPERLPPGKEMIERVMPPDSAYGIVVEKNLFSSNRTESLPLKEKAVLPKIPQPAIFLYGVVLAGDRKQALISNPESGPDAGKKTAKGKWIKIGDAVGPLKVSDIRKDRIILTEGVSTQEILLYDPNKPARKLVAAKPSSESATAMKDSTATGAREASGRPAASGATGVSVESPASPKPVPGAPASIAADGKNAPTGEYQVINTPFGPVKRRTP